MPNVYLCLFLNPGSVRSFLLFKPIKHRIFSLKIVSQAWCLSPPAVYWISILLVDWLMTTQRAQTLEKQHDQVKRTASSGSNLKLKRVGSVELRFLKEIFNCYRAGMSQLSFFAENCSRRLTKWWWVRYSCQFLFCYVLPSAQYAHLTRLKIVVEALYLSTSPFGSCRCFSSNSFMGKLLSTYKTHLTYARCNPSQQIHKTTLNLLPLFRNNHFPTNQTCFLSQACLQHHRFYQPTPPSPHQQCLCEPSLTKSRR